MTRPGRYPRSCGSGPSGWCWSTRTSTPGSGWRSPRSPTVWGVVGDAAQVGASGRADAGLRPGLTSDERERLKTLERENRELRRANEILKSAAAFFGRSWTADRRDDRRHRRPQGPLWGRADLPGAADRPVHLPCRPPPTASARAVRDRQLKLRSAGSMPSTSASRAPARCGGSCTAKGSRWPAAPSSD
jgi:hypothetical protein